MPEPVIYVLRSWPRLSQTFILDEILALERRGLELVILSLTRSHERVVQPGVAEVRSSVDYLEDAFDRPLRRRMLTHLRVLRRFPLAYARTMLTCLLRPRLAAGYGDCSAWRCHCLAVQAAAMVEKMRADGRSPRHVHAHFAHDPALVGLLAARLTGMRFSFTAHARDLVQIPPAALIARAREAVAIITCCLVNADYIHTVVPASVLPPVKVIHHGVDLTRLAPPSHHRLVSDVASLLSVGRLVEKKGHVDLLHALALVGRTGEAFRCTVVGSGPLDGQLRRLADDLGLRDHVALVGALDHGKLVEQLRATDIFVLTPRVAADGDRDGIPNVLVEAMAMGLPVVTTDAGGVTELVEHGVNGLVAPVGDVAAVADLVRTLLADPDRRRQLGVAARETVERDYDVDAAASALERLLLPQSETMVVGR